MNIGRISGTAFKAAYYVKGRGASVKAVEDFIEKRNNKEKIYVERVGIGYTTCDLPACIFVTTGEDALAYRDFVPNKRKYIDSTRKSSPMTLSRDDFARYEDFVAYKAEYELGIHIATVAKHCKLADAPDLFNSDKVLKSIKHDEFNIEEGEI